MTSKPRRSYDLGQCGGKYGALYVDLTESSPAGWLRGQRKPVLGFKMLGSVKNAVLPKPQHYFAV
jgi:hypothetical protein